MNYKPKICLSQRLKSQRKFSLDRLLIHFSSSTTQGEACNKSVRHCKCTKYPFISLLQKKATLLTINNNKHLSFAQLHPACTNSVELCCHPFTTNPDKTRLSEDGIVITARGSRNGGRWTFYCSLKNTSIMSHTWHLLSTTRRVSRMCNPVKRKSKSSKNLSDI